MYDCAALTRNKSTSVLLIIFASFALNSCSNQRLVSSSSLYAQTEVDDAASQIYFLPKGVVSITVSGLPGGMSQSNNVLPDSPSVGGNAPNPGTMGAGSMAKPLSAASDISPNLRLPPVISAVETSYIADPRYGFRISWTKSAFSGDNITISSGADGLLTSIVTESQDASPALVKNLSDFFVSAAKRTVEAPVTPNQIKAEIDPTSPEDIKRLNELLAAQSQNVGGKRLRLEVLREFTMPKESTGEPSKVCSGVCHRPRLPYELVLMDEDKEVSRKRVWLPNEAPVMSAEITRAAFVKKKVTLTFQQGFLIETKIDQPSQAVGFLSIPIDVAKAIISIPSAIFQFRVTRVTDDKNLLQAQTELLQQQKSLLDAAKELQNQSGSEN